MPNKYKLGRQKINATSPAIKILPHITQEYGSSVTDPSSYPPRIIGDKEYCLNYLSSGEFKAILSQDKRTLFLNDPFMIAALGTLTNIERFNITLSLIASNASAGAFLQEFKSQTLKAVCLSRVLLNNFSQKDLQSKCTSVSTASMTYSNKIQSKSFAEIFDEVHSTLLPEGDTSLQLDLE